MAQNKNELFLNRVNLVNKSVADLDFKIEENPMFIDDRYKNVVDRFGNNRGTSFAAENNYKIYFSLNDEEKISIDVYDQDDGGVVCYFERVMSLPVYGWGDYLTDKNYQNRIKVTEVQDKNGNIESIIVKMFETPIVGKMYADGKLYIKKVGDLTESSFEATSFKDEGVKKHGFRLIENGETYYVETIDKDKKIDLEPVCVMNNEEHAYDDINQLILNVECWIKEFKKYKRQHPKHEEEETSDRT